MEVNARGIHRRIIFDVTDALRSRFAARVLRQGHDDCWPWLGAIRNGYGCIKHQKRVLSSHVVAWSIANNRQPAAGKLILHTCDNRICCNPSHLYEGTAQNNVRDMDVRRAIARPRGEDLPSSVLTEEHVRLILSLRICLRYGYRRLSKILNLNEWLIDSVFRRKTWRHVSTPTTQEAARIVAAFRQTK
jgi:hypothetical protein